MDAAGYWQLSGLCADGDFVWREHPIAYRTPGYPAFLGLVRQVAGSHAWQAVIALQHCFLVITAAITAWIVRQVTGSDRWGLAGYVLAAACLLRTWYAQALLTETFFIVLVTTHFACLLHCLQRVTAARCSAVGLTLGLTILVRPIVQLWWLPAIGLIMTVGAGATLPQRVRRGLGAAAAVAVVVMPWFVRNQIVFGEPFLTEFLGRNLWIVTFQDGSGAGLSYPNTDAGRKLLQNTAIHQFDPELQHTWTVSDQLTSSGMADDDVDRMMKRVCMDAIRADAGRFTLSAARRLINFWRCVPDPYPYLNAADTGPPAGQIAWGSHTLTKWETQWHQHVLQQYLYWNEFVAACVIAATLLMIADRQVRWFGVALLIFFAMISGLTALVEIPNIRYRIVLEPLMIVTVCWGAHRLNRIRSSGRITAPPQVSTSAERIGNA